MRRDALAGVEGAALQRGLGDQRDRRAVLAGAHVAQHGAGARAHRGGGGIGCAHQRGGDRRLARVQPVRGLAEQRAREGVNAGDLAAKWHQVEVGLQDLVLAPVGFQAQRRRRLADLARHAAPAGAARVVLVEQAGQLHGQRAGAARAAVPQVAEGGRSHGAPIDAAVLIKATVLRQHQRLAQRRRDLGQRHPVATAHARVGAQALDEFAMAVENARFRRAEVAPDLGKARQRARQARHRQPGGQRQRGGGMRVHGCTTLNRALGASPNTSGAYMASTRVGGKPNSPALFNRTRYSTLNEPLGRYA
jgi:hypothetical protein